MTGEPAHFETACGPRGLGLIKLGWENSVQKERSKGHIRGAGISTLGVDSSRMDMYLHRIRALWVEGTQLISVRPKSRNSDREPMAEELSSGQRNLSQGSFGQVDQIRVVQITRAQAG